MSRDERDAATPCEWGYAADDERDSCACGSCEQRNLVRDLVALLREFEQLPIRRLTSETAVMERSPLDSWRAKCGQAVRRAE